MHIKMIGRIDEYKRDEEDGGEKIELTVDLRGKTPMGKEVTAQLFFDGVQPEMIKELKLGQQILVEVEFDPKL